jgi:hypothetical protein
MVAYSFIQRLNPNAALALAGAAGVVAALAALLLPGALFEAIVLTSGIAAFVPAAEPPLGATARICLAVFAGGSAAALAWAALSLLPGLLRLPHVDAQRRPSVRRADAHPDAPPREPLRAGRDLGFEQPADAEDAAVELADPELSPLPPEPVIAMGMAVPLAAPAPEPAPAAPASFADPAAAALLADRPREPSIEPPPVQPLPADLDQPLAAFDPGALPAAPLSAPRPLAPLHREPPSPPVYADGERFETFNLAPPVPAAPPITGAETVATVHSLLDRLERGIARRGQPVEAASRPMPQAQGLDSTLDQLRRMAARA